MDFSNIFLYTELTSNIAYDIIFSRVYFKGDQDMEKDLTIQKIHKVFEGDFNIGHLESKNGRHSDALCCFPYGRALYSFDGYSFEVSAGEVFFLSRGSKYTIDVLEKSKFICVDFDFPENENVRKSCLFNGIAQSVKNDFSKLLRIWRTNDACRMSLAFSVLYNIYYEAIKTQNGAYTRSSELFSKITSYILDNYKDPALSVSDLVNISGISDVHIRRIFKSEANTTPIRYINFVRLEQAENMLRSSNLSVAEISDAVGFSDPFYFSRLFKHSFGVSPSAYRKM